MSEQLKPDVWSKEGWHKIIEDSNGQFDALAGILRAIYQQGFELAVIELRNEVMPDMKDLRARIDKQNELLKNLIKTNKELAETNSKLEQLKIQ